jgi:hypothetical protein
VTFVQIDSKTAEASLADIETVVARLKQSSTYRRTGTIIVIWGVLTAAAYLICQWMPRQASVVWPIDYVLGLIATVVIGWRQQRASANFDWRIVIALLLFVGFGFICCGLGHFGPRELNVFWPILFMFGYAVAGLWLGRAFVMLGIGVALLAFAGYLFVETWFQTYLAVVNGGGLILAGLWMRRA